MLYTLTGAFRVCQYSGIPSREKLKKNIYFRTVGLSGTSVSYNQQ